MAKRFLDSNVFKDPFIRGLEGASKLLWMYIICECSPSGLWPAELDVASIRCGMKFNEDQIKKDFGDKVVFLENGATWFIPSFIKIQYGNELKSSNPATKKVIEGLLKHDLIEEKSKGTFVLKKSSSEAPLKGLKEEDKEKEEVKEEEGEKEKEEEKQKAPKQEQKQDVQFPWQDESFLGQWELWKDYKRHEHKFKYKTAQSEQAALTELCNISDGDMQTGIQVIHQSMANGWKGFFKLKNENGNGKQQSYSGFEADLDSWFANQER